MSNIPKLLYNRLIWCEYLYILSYLTTDEIYCIGKCCKNGLIVYLREKNIRLYYNNLNIYTSSPCRFLSQGLQQEKVILVSYPRSGNSFLRLLLENKTGIITGSDSRTNRTLAAALLRCGFRGEGIVDSSVWIIKTHYPERMGYIKFLSKRVVLLVRNPFDALESYFHMGFTNTHNKTLTDEALFKLSDIWNKYIESEINVWVAFHEWWLTHMERIPTIILRYEDLLNNQSTSVSNLLDFLNKGSIPIGYERNLKDNDMTNSSNTNSTGYKPKKGGIGKSFRLLTDDQVSNIESKCSHLLRLFGYTVLKNDYNNNSSSSSRIYSGVDLAPFNINDINDESFSKFPISSVIEGKVIINDNYSVRGEHDQFGRKMTPLRKSLTNNDTAPFPVCE